jgi:3,4-dihydroxy 2-butanone 4-phosphate synthase/GTP cyclohydrolase II
MDQSGVQLKMDSRDYGVGAQILRELGVRKMNLITSNNSARQINLGFGLEITGSIHVSELKVVG